MEHQMWSCPRWHSTRVRAAAAFSQDCELLITRLGPLTLHSLLRPPCPAAQAASRLLAAVPWTLPPLGPQAVGREEAWTDGAASRAGMPGLARAAWAFHFGIGDRETSGPVPGQQTAERAELYAAIQAAAARRGPLLIITDSRYVSVGFARLAARTVPPYHSHQDLWEAAIFLECGTAVQAQWVPARRPGPDPPVLTERDWLGNARADALATQALAAAQPPEILLAAAAQAEKEYLAAVHVGAAVLEAQLAWAHAGRATGPTRFPRTRVRIRFQARPRRLAAAALGPPGPRLLQVEGDERPVGIHALVFRALVDGTPHLHCTTCGRTVISRNQWTHLACRPGCGQYTQYTHTRGRDVGERIPSSGPRRPAHGYLYAVRAAHRPSKSFPVATAYVG